MSATAPDEMTSDDRAREPHARLSAPDRPKARPVYNEVGGLRTEVGERLGPIEDELLVLNGIALRLEGREVETTRPQGDS
jgi:hypothetical protein